MIRWQVKKNAVDFKTQLKLYTDCLKGRHDDWIDFVETDDWIEFVEIWEPSISIEDRNRHENNI